MARSEAHSCRYPASSEAASSEAVSGRRVPSKAGKTGACGAMNRRPAGILPREAARTMPATLLDSSVTPAVGRPARPAKITIARSQSMSSRVEPADEPVRDVHAGQVERRDHDPVERDREVAAAGPSR